MIKIRECKLEDCEIIYRLNKDEMGYDYPLEETMKKLEFLLQSDNDKIYVAVIDDNVVGYIHANNYDVIYFPHMKNIMGIAVDKKYKRQGIGRKLLEAVEKWANETNARGIRLVSGASRKSAHEFYRNCGYDGGKEQLNFKKFF